MPELSMMPLEESLAVLDSEERSRRNMRLARDREAMQDAILLCDSVTAARRLVREEVSSLIHDVGCLTEERARKIVRDNIRYILTAHLSSREDVLDLTAVFAQEEGREVPCKHL